jgi:hypothetical protein
VTKWTDLLDSIGRMSEAELKAAIDAEAKRPEPRASHLTRLHMRFSKVRAARERAELLRRLV